MRWWQPWSMLGMQAPEPEPEEELREAVEVDIGIGRIRHYGDLDEKHFHADGEER